MVQGALDKSVSKIPLMEMSGPACSHSDRGVVEGDPGQEEGSAPEESIRHHSQVKREEVFCISPVGGRL